MVDTQDKDKVVEDIVKPPDKSEAILSLLQMDINKLTLEQRGQYLWHMAVRRGLDPTTKPFDCIPNDKGQLIVYANSGCADQLRALHQITTTVIYAGPLQMGDSTLDPEVYVVRVQAVRHDNETQTENIGAVGLLGLNPLGRANAVMKAYTKAMRRAILDLANLGLPDVSELDYIPNRPQPQLDQPRLISPKPVVQPEPPLPAVQTQPQPQVNGKVTPAPVRVNVPRTGLPQAK